MTPATLALWGRILSINQTHSAAFVEQTRTARVALRYGLCLASSIQHHSLHRCTGMVVWDSVIWDSSMHTCRGCFGLEMSRPIDSGIAALVSHCITYTLHHFN